MISCLSLSLAFDLWPLQIRQETEDGPWISSLLKVMCKALEAWLFLFLAAFSLKIWAWLNHTWYSQLEELQNVTTFEVLQNVRFLCLVFPSFQDSLHTYTVTVATVADLWVCSSEHIHTESHRDKFAERIGCPASDLLWQRFGIQTSSKSSLCIKYIRCMNRLCQDP